MIDDVDKKFAYSIIFLIIIIIFTGVFIDRIELFGKNLRSDSWYIYCDLKWRSCSCNVYGSRDDGRVSACVDFMKLYYLENNRTIIPSTNESVLSNTNNSITIN